MGAGETMRAYGSLGAIVPTAAVLCLITSLTVASPVGNGDMISSVGNGDMIVVGDDVGAIMSTAADVGLIVGDGLSIGCAMGRAVF